MAENIIFKSGQYNKQELVDFAAKTLAPYTVLDCIYDDSSTSDPGPSGMKLIYTKMNTDIKGSVKDSMEEGKLVFFDSATDGDDTTCRFRLLNMGGSSSGSGDASIADTVLGGDGKFHDTVKYAANLYSTLSTPGKYIVFQNVTNSDQTTDFVVPPAPASYSQALIFDKDGSLTWGAAGAKLKNKNGDDSAHYIIGTIDNNTSIDDTAPSELAYDTRVYFKGGSLYHSSDETLKTFTSDIDINLDNLATIKKGVFYWNSDPDKNSNIGVSAQTVEALYPELVSEDRGYKSVDYAKLSVIALAAIDKLNDRIKELEKEIEDLKK
jgi:hypothetical protein